MQLLGSLRVYMLASKLAPSVPRVEMVRAATVPSDWMPTAKARGSPTHPEPPLYSSIGTSLAEAFSVSTSRERSYRQARS